MASITKQDIANHLIEKQIAKAFDKNPQQNKDLAKAFVDLMLEEIRQSLIKGEEVKLSGFGNFEVRNKNARPGRNPKTGESIPVSARRVVVFRAGKKLREKVADTIPE